jgi:Putative adhesin
MALSARSTTTLGLHAALLVLLAAPGCVDIVGADLGRAKYVERDEKHFPVTGKPEVVLGTFDGSIEIRPWDKPDVQVVVEKRGRDKDDVAAIIVQATQNGNRIEVTVTEPKNAGGFNLHFNNHRSAKLIVSVPATSDVSAKSGDGSIDIEQVTGRLQMRSGDGSIRGRSLAGDVNAHTGDGSIKLDGVNGTLNVDTGDGSITLAGALTSVHARTGDGSVTIHADSGSTPSADWDITTGDGSVTLAVPDGFAAELDAHTGDGGIRMEDITLSNVTGKIGRSTLRGRLGAGGPNVRLRTGDGSITLKRSLTAERTEP